MELKNIKLADLWTSKSNPRGEVVKDKNFADLVDSVKAKGVLQAILVRPKRGKVNAYEVVAGNRRVEAARAAGLKEIPAKVAEMTDQEAAEAAIVENLQRSDVHPIEEGVAYRKLIEETKRDMKSIAAKVGKSETYIRQRLMLTNLCDEARKEYRAGSVNDGQAAEIARLSPGGDQQKAITYVRQRTSYGHVVKTYELHNWIQSEFFTELAFQPWLKDKEAMKAVGPCIECPKNTDTLFGEVKEGACTTTRCLKRKLLKYIKWVKENNPEILFVRNDWGAATPGLLGKGSFDKVKMSVKGAREALIIEGAGRGKIIYIKTSHEQVSQMTPEQKRVHDKKLAKEKKEREKKEAAERKREEKKMNEVLSRISWPLKDKQLEVLFDIVVDNANNIEEIVARRELDGQRDSDGELKDTEKVLRTEFLKADAKGKIRIVFDVLLSDIWEGRRNGFIKKI